MFKLEELSGALEWSKKVLKFLGRYNLNGVHLTTIIRILEREISKEQCGREMAEKINAEFRERNKSVAND